MTQAQREAHERMTAKLPSRYVDRSSAGWEPNLAFDYETGGRCLSEEERQIARRLRNAQL